VSEPTAPLEGLEPGFKTRNLIGFARGFAGSEIADAWAAGMRKAGLPE
jgi:hypothetical protein